MLVIILLWGGEAVLSEGYGRASGIIATLAVATNLAALMSRLAATPGLSRRLQVGSYGLTALTALLIIVGILAQLDMGRYWIAVFGLRDLARRRHPRRPDRRPSGPRRRGPR